LKNFSEYSLVRDLDLYHYWEPFHQEEIIQSGLKIYQLLLDLSKKQKAFGSFPDTEDAPIPKITSPLLIAYDTLNQKAALSNLMDGIGGKSKVISFHPNHRNLNIDERTWTQLALDYKKEFLKGALKFKGYDKRVFKWRWEKYYEILGVYEYIRRMMEKSIPELKLFIGANDHSGLSQYGFVAARMLGLESLYIQHAAVSDKFPPLRMTYALLDGQDARDKYLSAGNTDTEIRLIGAMKYDTYLSSPEVNQSGSLVGICFSHVAHDLHENLALCEALEKEGVDFALRFHPAVKKDVRNKFSSRGWEISEPETENSLDFVMRCHSIVSSDSNILLEAILMKRRSVYFSSDKQSMDYYGFAKKGVVEKICLSWKDVMNLLSTEFDLETHRRRAKYFHDPLYTEWEGRSTELAIKYIEELTGIELE